MILSIIHWCTSFLEKNAIKWVRSTPRSPDLNPIEMLWNEMKCFVRKSGCKTKSDIVNKIYEFQRSLTQKKCQKYIYRLKKESVNN
ncbi:unnamed protein product [Brachionus calyciflorus]|uniref:Tc1-like transposase DDE domain-containing protein n=1 Tax=Brachionus calyciflorus TaxID=104777 RepID=A0A814EXK8_9BILA|nr:unnamed protein product [Brachionus calyciflorus]